jgi:YD repeat-containing protein
VTVTDAAGGVTRYTYDAKDRLVSVRDPINLTTTYTYDALGNLVQLAALTPAFRHSCPTLRAM